MLIASRSATAVMSNLSAARYMVGFSGVQGLSRWSVPGSNRQTFEILKGVPEERALLHEVEEAARQNDQIANAYYGDEMLSRSGGAVCGRATKSGLDRGGSR